MSLRSAVLDPLRRRGTIILMPQESFGVGNLLYFWLQAAVRGDRGEPTAVRVTSRMAEWSGVFSVDDLVVAPDDVSFFCPREVGDVYQQFGVDFAPGDLGDFIGSRLLGGFEHLIPASPPADLTINIRRGDYYSVPEFRGRYSFDVVEYVRTALVVAREAEEVRSVLLVSDDLDWCRLKLAPLLEGMDVRSPDPATPVPHQLALLAGSRRLVLTNSTFSYWGGYLSTHLHDDAQVIAPWFHSRGWGGGAATQLDPRWSVIRDIPGGWDG